MPFSAAPLRTSLGWRLLATTCMAALLGACTQTARLPFAGASNPPTQLAASEMAADPSSVVAQWAAAYAHKPRDPGLALGYAQSLRAVGAKDRAFAILQAALQANPQDGPLAAELGKLAVEMGNAELAKQAFAIAEAQGVRDWKTLSAQGTMHARLGEHAQAQRYFLAALQLQPNSTSVASNLALSYALDSKPAEAEGVLRKAMKDGREDRRLRQTLALVLGLQGKFEEAKTLAAVDLPEEEARARIAYLRDMTRKPTSVALLPEEEGDGDWQPFDTDAASAEAPSADHVAAAAEQSKAKESRGARTSEPETPKIVQSEAAPLPVLQTKPAHVKAPLAAEPGPERNLQPEPVEASRQTPVAKSAPEAPANSSTHGKTKTGRADVPTLVTQASFVTKPLKADKAVSASDSGPVDNLLRTAVE